jgi:hypothetical protein
MKDILYSDQRQREKYEQPELLCKIQELLLEW